MDNEKIKVLVVDDATFMVKAVSDILESDPMVEVIGTAKNGLEGLEKVKELQPDVITLDMDMPVMDGIRAIRHIMIEAPVPIVVLSSLYNDGSITFEALRLGVVDFVPKPSGAVSRDIHSASQKIIDRIKIATAVNIDNIRRVRLPKMDVEDSLSERYGFQHLDYIIAIGTTLTGPNTFIRLLSNLSPQLPATTVIVMDIATQILDSFVRKFDEHTHWKIEIARDGTVMEQGTCYLASNENTVSIKTNENAEAILKVTEASEQPLDQLFSSAAEIFKQNTVGILLTGIGKDGAKGFAKIKNKAGTTIAQSTDTCVYPNLTQHAVEQGTVDHLVEENEIVNEVEAIMA
ncbi:MAG: chemotaxis protein CheB [Desulfobulbaceae bacterium]|nr:chemotaxis protein CheB [Desulfobulbaceae bacterium]